MVLCRVGNFCSTQDMEKFNLKLSVNFAVKNIQKLNSASIEFFFPFLPELEGEGIMIDNGWWIKIVSGFL